LRRRDHTGPGPFLSTPDQLIDPLLDLAEIGPLDTVLDFGCGDGRLLIAAAERGSRAIGVEGDSAVAERARRRAAESGVGDRVRVVHGDAWRVDLGDVTVVFLFLPADLVPRVLRHALRRLPRGARVVAHEQSPIPDPPRPPDATRALITDGAVTVAHVWRVP
jgi:precorrin-6B methylase 2